LIVAWGCDSGVKNCRLRRFVTKPLHKPASILRDVYCTRTRRASTHRTSTHCARNDYARNDWARNDRV
jgi:hypothetical protein